MTSKIWRFTAMSHSNPNNHNTCNRSTCSRSTCNNQRMGTWHPRNKVTWGTLRSSSTCSRSTVPLRGASHPPCRNSHRPKLLCLNKRRCRPNSLSNLPKPRRRRHNNNKSNRRSRRSLLGVTPTPRLPKVSSFRLLAALHRRVESPKRLVPSRLRSLRLRSRSRLPSLRLL